MENKLLSIIANKSRLPKRRSIEWIGGIRIFHIQSARIDCLMWRIHFDWREWILIYDSCIRLWIKWMPEAKERKCLGKIQIVVVRTRVFEVCKFKVNKAGPKKNKIVQANSCKHHILGYKTQFLYYSNFFMRKNVCKVGISSSHKGNIGHWTLYPGQTLITLSLRTRTQ